MAENVIETFKKKKPKLSQNLQNERGKKMYPGNLQNDQNTHRTLKITKIPLETYKMMTIFLNL